MVITNHDSDNDLMGPKLNPNFIITNILPFFRTKKNVGKLPIKQSHNQAFSTLSIE